MKPRLMDLLRQPLWFELVLEQVAGAGEVVDFGVADDSLEHGGVIVASPKMVAQQLNARLYVSISETPPVAGRDGVAEKVW